MHHIKIIGAGQIGSRHLQALANIRFPLSIEVIDPSFSSLETAKARYEEVARDAKHTIYYHSDIQLYQKTEVAIIATSSNTRKKGLLDLLNKVESTYIILEKLLFNNEADYNLIEKTLALYPTKVWVNCCMRMIPYYQSLKKLFLNSSVNYTVQGSNYGLITNAIHYLDHLAYLTGCDDFTVDCNYLDNQIIASKRSGFYEVTGNLLAKFSNGSTAMITSDSAGTAPIQVEISNHSHRVISREWQHLAYVASLQNNWTWQEVPANILFQSELTTTLIENIIKNGSCNLPTYAESSKIHLQLLKPIKTFLRDKPIRINCDYPFT